MLTANQENYILEYFFKKEEYPGWKSIALNLLRKGECIVAGTERLWKGGIGNFISVEEADNLVECSLYVFNLHIFLESNFFMEANALYLKELELEMDSLVRKQAELHIKISEIKSLVKN